MTRFDLFFAGVSILVIVVVRAGWQWKLAYDRAGVTTTGFDERE